MVLTALVVGAVALYYWGVRVAAWAAGATVALSVVALVVPSRYAAAIHALIAVGAFTLWLVGRKRPRPPDAVIAVRLVTGGVKRAWAKLRGGDDS